MAEVRFQTERLVLRGEAPGDLAIWLEHMNTPAVMARLGGVQSADQVAQGFARMGAQDDGAPGFWFIARKADGMLIGKCGASRIETPTAPEELHGAMQIGWTLRADCWGQGYASEAAAAVLAMAFAADEVDHVFAQTSESNVASWRLMQRIGMTRRADLDYADPDYPPEDNPTMVWQLARADWPPGRAGG